MVSQNAQNTVIQALKATGVDYVKKLIHKLHNSSGSQVKNIQYLVEILEKWEGGASHQNAANSELNQS